MVAMYDQARVVLKKELETVMSSISEISKALKGAKEKQKSLEHALKVLGESPPLQ